MADLIDRLQKTAADLGEHRQTHVVWRDWLQSDPANEKVNPHAGSAAFHASVVIDYDRHIANINEAIAAIEDSRRIDWIALQGDEFSAGIIVDAPGDGDYYAHGHRLYSYGTGKTFRDAVDAAIAAEAATLQREAAMRQDQGAGVE